MSIPILDAAALASGDAVERDTLVREFGHAYRTVGFSYLVNHGIDRDLVSRMFAASRQFHGLPRAEKMAIELDAANRGFLPINTSTDVNTELAEVTAPNQSESFLAMCEHAPDSPEVLAGDYLAGQNRWPDLPGFADTVMQYHAPHRDFGCLTFLAQDDTGGLAVGTPSGEWIEVPPLDGAFVLNVGDMLHQWSNGQFLSTPHRVINRSSSARYSIPFFFDPHESTMISPLDSCVSEEQPAAFGPVRFGDHLRYEMESGFSHHDKFSRGS